jgi:hypothetical protein
MVYRIASRRIMVQSVREKRPISWAGFPSSPVIRRGRDGSGKFHAAAIIAADLRKS